MSGRLAGRVAVVTGAGTGLGRAIAERFAEEGAVLTLVGRRREPLEATAAGIAAAGGAALVHAADVSSERQVQDLVRETVRQHGGLDILVNAAGIQGPVAPIWESPLEGWQETLAINLTGPWLCCREALRLMTRQRSGKIVNIGSINGKRPRETRTPYVASKLGLLALTRTLAAEAGPYNVNVNIVSPGPIVTPPFFALAAKLGREPEELRTALGQAAALKRMAEPVDVANCALFLASEEARNITGCDITVDAGTVYT